MKTVRLDVFGRRVTAEKCDTGWRLYLPGDEGKRRPVPDVEIPVAIRSVDALLKFLDDHFHEMATPAHAVVRVIDAD